MIERHTFKSLIETITYMEEGIQKLEQALNCYFDANWMTETPSKLIRAITESFFEEVTTDGLKEAQADVIEELLYHFIYMEDCGNDSEHCKTELVKISNDKGEEASLSCANLDELYNVIRTYLQRDDINFHFNYCHSHSQDDTLK